MELEQIKELIKQFETGKAKKLSLKKGDFELTLEKEIDPSKVATNFLPPTYHPPASTRFEHHSSLEPVQAGETFSNKYITSPMVGTFYAAPAPGQPSFIKVGDQVEESTVVCVVEAMKVMNEVKAGVNGTISEILIDNAHPVEFGTKIFSVT